MNTREFFRVACRLLAIIILAQALTRLPHDIALFAFRVSSYYSDGLVVLIEFGVSVFAARTL